MQRHLDEMHTCARAKECSFQDFVKFCNNLWWSGNVRLHDYLGEASKFCFSCVSSICILANLVRVSSSGPLTA